MSTKSAHAVVDGFNIRISNETHCPHCGTPLSPHAVEPYAPNAWRVLCQSCHGDVLVIEPAE